MFNAPISFALAGALFASAWATADAARADPAYPPSPPLLSTSETVLGQPLAYPPGAARVTAVIVTMTPGQETPWHEHDAPMFAHILDGEITVDYGPDGERTYAAGDSLVEAVGYRHRGRNSGAVDARLICVFMGAEGVENTAIDP
jgi:quercetin dioxygenase-like cupin family protein